MSMKSHRLELKVPPLVVVAIVALLMWIVARATPALIVLYPGRRLICALLLVLGVGTIAAGVIAFSKASTTVDPRSPQNVSSVVTSGIYRFTRNPMYLGMLLILLAWMFLIANLAAAIFPALFVAYIGRFQIVPEERILSEKFGAPYQMYCSSVRRWL